jgi:hypothetical protein
VLPEHANCRSPRFPPAGIEYSGYVAVPYNDETLLPVNDTWHPKIDDVVYNAMDWDCPGYNQVPQAPCVRVIISRVTAHVCV